MNLVISNEYTEQTKRAMAMLNEKETSFELIEVGTSLSNDIMKGA